MAEAETPPEPDGDTGALEAVVRHDRARVRWRREELPGGVAWKPPTVTRFDGQPANDGSEDRAFEPHPATTGGAFGRRDIPPGVVRHLATDPTARRDRRWIGWTIAGVGALIAALLGVMAGGGLAL
jgi:hypothetical protein